jgi:hypothetical protein
MPDENHLFARVGRCLGGADFVDALSEALAINRRTVQRWAAGTMYPPREVWERLAVRLKSHAVQAGALAAEIAARLATDGDAG